MGCNEALDKPFRLASSPLLGLAEPFRSAMRLYSRVAFRIDYHPLISSRH
jgi:hypothetical protein